MVDSVPVIDFTAYSLERDSPDPERIQRLVDDVHTALTTIGFMYLKNFGISQQKIKDAFSYSKKFFVLTVKEKLQYAKPDDENHGYFQMEREGLNPDRPFKDLKEGFNYAPSAFNKMFPDKDVPEFRRAVTDLFEAVIPLHQRILEVMAMGLGLDRHYLTERHKYMGTAKNTATLRTLYYPPLTNVEVKKDQVRCGEHSDYGGITLLFQDTQAGLEVRNIHDKWIPADPVEGTVVVNIGDLMQRWTSDKLIASKHRVMLPVEQIQLQKERQSIAFFGHPDNGVIIECIDKSNKYPPIESVAYLDERFSVTYASSSKLKTY
ncbi:uncharacterized protein [Diadema antillarum]|uniref:uncharacterized protein n=1 Tax=Diadema antillarum TaxID=105358 RepID=UPI003A863D95